MMRSMRKKFSLLVVVALALCGQVSIAQNKQAPTINQWFGFRSVTNTRISPDGRFVAYETFRGNLETNAFENGVEWVETANGERRQIMNTKGSNYGAAWTPNSKFLLFLSTREGRPQIFLTPAQGGEVAQLTKVETGVGSFDISPDGRRVAFTTADPEPQHLKERREKMSDFQIIGEPSPTQTHLWMFELTDDRTKLAQPERLTSGSDFTVTGYSWSPDSTRLAFSATRPTENYGAFRGPDIKTWAANDIYVLKLDDKSVKKLVGNRGQDFGPTWSPDGKQLAYVTSNAALGEDPAFYAITYIAVVSAEGGTPRVLTTEFDESPNLLAWSPDGVYFSALQKTSSHLFKLNPETRAVTRLSAPEQAIYNQFSFTKDFRSAAFISEDGRRLPEVQLTRLQPFAPTSVTAMNDQLKDFRHSTREVVAWKSQDGTIIEGVLVKPDGYDASKKYPLLVVIHTGPTWLDQPSLNPSSDIYPIEPLAARGALLLLPNYRGSIGYGNRFRALLVRNLGLPQYQDIISGVDHLIGLGLIDKERVGVMGYSHGGYLAAFIAAYSDRFKAVSMGAGVSDWRIFYAGSDAGPGMLGLLRATPSDDPDYYREAAPVTYVKRARTPTLIQHGDADRRAPIASSYEMYRALKDQGVNVRMIVYRGAGHSGGSWTLKQYSAFKQHNYDWFGQWIWGDTASQ